MQHETMTYAQLDDLFTQLGYRLMPRNEGGPRVWENPKFDAVQLVRNASPNEKVAPHYLLTLRKISIEKGIVEEEEFEEKLNKILHTSSETRNAA
jgi:hypothetical protein